MPEKRTDRTLPKYQTKPETPSPGFGGTQQPNRSESDSCAELRTICICVDDFGVNTGVNLAALQLAGMERVHAIGCRVGGDDWKTWGKLARRLDADGMDLGLRLDLTKYRLLPGQGCGFEALVAASHACTLRRA